MKSWRQNVGSELQKLLEPCTMYLRTWKVLGNYARSLSSRNKLSRDEPLNFIGDLLKELGGGAERTGVRCDLIRQLTRHKLLHTRYYGDFSWLWARTRTLLVIFLNLKIPNTTLVS